MSLSARTMKLKGAGRKALVAYLTAGYPDEKTFLQLLESASTAGCDVIEIGIPFSDPIADGPVIQAASTAALSQGMTLVRALELAAQASPRIDAALVLMTYVNPVLRFGAARLGATAAHAGVSGIILPDVPLEESSELRSTLGASGLEWIELVAPTSGAERIERIVADARGFVYLVSVTGVTGSRTAAGDEIAAFVGRVREHTTLPLYVGFGVSTPEQAAAVTESADGVIIGSELLRRAAAGPVAGAAARVGEFLAQVRRAIDA